MFARGTFLMLIGQASFMLSAVVINFGLARLLGPVDFGTFGLVMSALVAAERFVVTGIPELVQKLGGERPESMYSLVRKTFPPQLIYTLAVFAVFWFLAPLVTKSFGDPALQFFLRLASFDIFFYGVFRYYLGIQNGLHRFGRHALLSVTYSVVKVATIFGLVFGGFSLMGAVIGNTLGTVGGLVVALGITRLLKVQREVSPIPYLQFVVPNVLYFMGLYLFFCVDLWFVKYYLSDATVGYYVSASTLAKAPYFLSLALSAALLPSVARAIKEKDTDRTKELVQESLRYLLMFLLVINVVVISTSSSLVVTFFGQVYEEASSVLSILIVGLSFVTFFAVMNTILMAYNRMRTVFVITFVLLVLDVLFNGILVLRFGIEGAAMSTTLVAVMGAVASGCVVFSELRTLLPMLSALRMVCAAAVVFFLSFLVPEGGFWNFIKWIGLVGGYFALLGLMGEINAVEMRRLKNVLSIG